MIYYILTLIAAIGTAGNFAVTKVYQKEMVSGVREGVIFNIFVGLFSGIIFFAASGFRLEFTAFSLIMAILFTLFVGSYTVIGFKIMSIGSMTVYTVFLMLGGAVVPYLYGIAFWGETVNLQKIAALLLVILAVWLNASGGKEQKQSAKFLLLCFAVFLLNGGTSVVSKAHQIEKIYPTISAQEFVVLKDFARFVCFSLFLPFCKKSENTHRLSPKMYAVMLLSAIASGGGYFLQLVCASYMPATILYPMVTCGTIAAAAAFDRICFGERLNKRTGLSVIACMAALALFVI